MAINHTFHGTAEQITAYRSIQEVTTEWTNHVSMGTQTKRAWKIIHTATGRIDQPQMYETREDALAYLAKIDTSTISDARPTPAGEPATEAQIKTVTRLLATADLTDIEGSIDLPRMDALTKTDASWWITRLAN